MISSVPTLIIGLLVVVAVGTSAQQNWTYVHAKNTCSMYGECGTSTTPGIPGTLNCPYNGPSFVVKKKKNLFWGHEIWVFSR